MENTSLVNKDMRVHGVSSLMLWVKQVELLHAFILNLLPGEEEGNGMGRRRGSRREGERGRMGRVGVEGKEIVRCGKNKRGWGD